MKPLLVGEQPSRSGDRYWEFPLSGAVAQALCQAAGIPPLPGESRYGQWTWALYEHFDCINVIERAGPWDELEAAAGLEKKLDPGREVVVLLGCRVQSAYEGLDPAGYSLLEGIDFYEWVVDKASPTGRREVVVIPHPSSLNRMYNVGINRRRAGLVLQAAIEKAKQMHETRL